MWCGREGADHECGLLAGGAMIGDDRPAPLPQVFFADQKKSTDKKRNATEIEA